MSDVVKSCFKCGEQKPLNHFYRHSKMADGHLNKCKPCTRADVKENRDKRLDYYREYDRRRGLRIYDEEKYKARAALWKLIRAGEIRRGTRCEECGSRNDIEAHHPDYSRPLFVEWLCKLCHARRHTEGE